MKEWLWEMEGCGGMDRWRGVYGDGWIEVHSGPAHPTILPHPAVYNCLPSSSKDPMANPHWQPKGNVAVSCHVPPHPSPSVSSCDDPRDGFSACLASRQCISEADGKGLGLGCPRQSIPLCQEDPSPGHRDHGRVCDVMHWPGATWQKLSAEGHVLQALALSSLAD